MPEPLGVHFRGAFEKSKYRTTVVINESDEYTRARVYRTSRGFVLPAAYCSDARYCNPAPVKHQRERSPRKLFNFTR